MKILERTQRTRRSFFRKKNEIASGEANKIGSLSNVDISMLECNGQLTWLNHPISACKPPSATKPFAPPAINKDKIWYTKISLKIHGSQLNTNTEIRCDERGTSRNRQGKTRLCFCCIPPKTRSDCWFAQHKSLQSLIASVVALP